MNDYYVSGVVTEGAWFTYKGVSYGKGTKILFTKAFYERVGALKKHCSYEVQPRQYVERFCTIEMRNGKKVWRFGQDCCVNISYTDIDPNRDIAKIVTPVWYMTKKDLVKYRLNNGTWINYIWKQTLFYVICLLISPIFQEWYLIWTIGLYAYLRLSHIELSKGELNRGW